MEEKKFHFDREEMEKLGVAGIFLFGSHAQGVSSDRSDYDFAVLLKDRKILSDNKKKHLVYDRLYDLFSGQIKKLCDIDIVFIQSCDLQVKFNVAKNGILLYLGDEKTVSDFLEDTLNSYADFAYFRKQFHEAILERI